MNVLGLAYIFLAGLAYGIMPIWAKLAYMTGLSAYQVLFLRGFIGACFLFIFIRGKKTSLKVEKSRIGSLLFVGSVGYTAAIITLYLSYSYINVGVATALHYSFPVVVMVLALIFYKEKLYPRKLLALILAVMGVYLMTAVGSIDLDRTGVILALISAITFAIYVLGVAHPSIKGIDSLVLAFYLSLISAGITFMIILGKGEWPIDLTGKGFLYVLLLGFFCTALALLFLNRGIQIVGPSTASILTTMEPVISIVAGMIILEEKV
ncbi:MAG: DMT family transporter, partial [Desulfitobacterium sp.]|nr:DMT family transporter [Desulfitobacterium sp.]